MGKFEDKTVEEKERLTEELRVEILNTLIERSSSSGHPIPDRSTAPKVKSGGVK